MNVFTLGFAAAVLIALAPVLLAALGGALCARVGVFNIGLEGQMLLGCFTAVAVSAKTGSAIDRQGKAVRWLVGHVRRDARERGFGRRGCQDVDRT